MQEMRNLGNYTRGAESLSHFFTMFRAGLRRHVVMSLGVAAVLGTCSMAGEVTSAERDLLGRAVFVDLAAWVAPDFEGTLRMPSGVERKMSNAKATAVFARHLAGRPGGFVARQWLTRTGGFAILLLPVFLVLMVAYGKILREARTVRGARLVDTLAPAYRHRARRRMIVVVAAAALVAAAAALVAKLGWTGFASIPDLIVATLAKHVGFIGALLSPEWDGARIWINVPDVRGLVTPESAAAAAGERIGVGISQIVLLAFGGAALGGTAAAFGMQRMREREADSDDLEVGGLRIPRRREVYHFLISGATGAGKSVASMHLLDQIRARGQRAIVFDTKGEYVERFYRPGKDIILNPLDARSACWTPWADVRRRADYLSLGKSLFPEIGTQDKFWQVAGASLFAAMAEQAQAKGYRRNSDLAEMLTRATLEDVKEAIAGTAGERFMDDDAGAMPTNLLATLTAHLEAFTFLADPEPGQEEFSIKDFVAQEQDRWLFLVMRGEDEAALRPLVSMWYDVAINAVLALPGEPENTPPERRRRVWAFLDELARLQKLPALETGVREGRGKGLAVVLGLQSMGDMRSTYGRDKAEAILGQPQIRLILRTVEPDTASWLERLLGQAEIIKSHESQSMGANSQRDGVNIQRQEKKESVVMAAQIQNLADLTGYLKLPTGPIHLIEYEPKDRKLVQPGFEPRKNDLGAVGGKSLSERMAERKLEEAQAAMAKGDNAGAKALALEVLDGPGGNVPALAGKAAELVENVDAEATGRGFGRAPTWVAGLRDKKAATEIADDASEDLVEESDSSTSDPLAFLQN